MTLLSRESRASYNLDLARGLAAMMVFAGHAFAIFFKTAADEGVALDLRHAWQGIIAYGHEAVIVFFVLSGYLIGSAVIRDVDRDRWSWKRYSVNRFSRLFIVLIPALVMGTALDWGGSSYFGDETIYGGGVRFHGIIERVSGWLSPTIFVGNLVFLQSIVVHTLGSNGPLWSLSYEFWYYVAFPFLWLAIKGSQPKATRILLFLAFVAVLLLIGKHAAARFAIWMLGVAVALLPPLPRMGKRLAGGAMLLVFLSMAALSRVAAGPLASDIVKDSLVGVAFMLLMIHILNAPERPVRKARASFSRSLSQLSYTLYLCHLPFLVFLHALIIGQGPQLKSGPTSFALIGLVLTITLIYAGALWWLFESRTDRLRRWLAVRLATSG